MTLRHSVMVSLMGRQADRFHEYQPARDLAERLTMVNRVRGVEGIEILFRVVGEGTARLAAHGPGDTVSCLGPLGRPFTLPSSTYFMP